MARLLIPTPLRKFTENRGYINTEGKTVAEAIAQLSGSYPELKKHLYDDSGKIRGFIRIYVGEEDIKVLKNEDTPLTEESIVSIIPAIAGGVS